MTADAPALTEALARIKRLRQENQVLRAVIAALERRIAGLAAENKALYHRLEEADRRAIRVPRKPSRGQAWVLVYRSRLRAEKALRCPREIEERGDLTVFECG
jgi:hypothetical protein